MATVDTTGGTTLPRNNGATIVFGGNIDSSGTVTNAPSTTIFGKSKTHKGHNLPVQRTGTNIGTQTAGAGGPFAFNMVGGAVIGKRMTTTVNGEANTVLLSGGHPIGVHRGSGHAAAHGIGAGISPLNYAVYVPIHFQEVNQALGVNTWDYVTGAITKGGTAGDRFRYHGSRSDLASNNPTDTAARAKTSGGVGGWDVHPGRITYNHGGYLPLSRYYNGVRQHLRQP